MQHKGVIKRIHLKRQMRKYLWNQSINQSISLYFRQCAHRTSSKKGKKREKKEKISHFLGLLV